MMASNSDATNTSYTSALEPGVSGQQFLQQQQQQFDQFNGSQNDMDSTEKVKSRWTRSFFTALDQSHNEERYICDICHKDLASPSTLKLHRNTHVIERRYKCETCQVSFHSQGHLQKHKRSSAHETRVEMTQAFGIPTRENPRPYGCPECDIAFRKHGHLAKHLRSKSHITKLESNGLIPVGTYSALEKCSNLELKERLITTNCEQSLRSLRSIAVALFQLDGKQSEQQKIDGQTAASGARLGPKQKQSAKQQLLADAARTPAAHTNGAYHLSASAAHRQPQSVNLTLFDDASNNNTVARGGGHLQPTSHLQSSHSVPVSVARSLITPSSSCPATLVNSGIAMIDSTRRMAAAPAATQQFSAGLAMATPNYTQHQHALMLRAQQQQQQQHCQTSPLIHAAAHYSGQQQHYQQQQQQISMATVTGGDELRHDTMSMPDSALGSASQTCTNEQLLYAAAARGSSFVPSSVAGPFAQHLL